MKIIFSAIFFLLVLISSAQVAPNKYFISFTDKNGTPYSIENPLDFLSQRAIDRRIRQGFPVTEEDLPVNPDYINTVKNIGVTILNPTKWLNGVTIYTNDPSKIDQIQALPFVSGVMKSQGVNAPQPIGKDKFMIEFSSAGPVSYLKQSNEGYDYGPSFNQIHMINGDVLHDSGYRGEGIIIAVLDAGFQNADILPVFDSMRNEGRMLGNRNFVTAGGNVFDPLISAHGTMVLSTMGGNIPGQIIGTAPKASYWLLRSEDAETEYIIEEYNWVSAAEFADSLGADVINSSLGYTGFDDPTYNHSCADMTGYTTPVTIGANMAAARGIAVINSAGNSGGSGWTCVGAPSDGDSVIAVGAVDPYGNYAFFSSVGVDTGGRVKPNVATQGQSVTVCGGGGAIITSNGTSFASPILAGMVACLWQAQPELTRKEILDAVQESASQYENPDSLLGYGIPDFAEALSILGIAGRPGYVSAVTYPNPFSDHLTLEFTLKDTSNEGIVRLYDILGKKAGEWYVDLKEGHNRIGLEVDPRLNAGIYLLSVADAEASFSVRVIKR